MCMYVCVCRLKIIAKWQGYYYTNLHTWPLSLTEKRRCFCLVSNHSATQRSQVWADLQVPVSNIRLQISSTYRTPLRQQMAFISKPLGTAGSRTQYPGGLKQEMRPSVQRTQESQGKGAVSCRRVGGSTKSIELSTELQKVLSSHTNTAQT